MEVKLICDGRKVELNDFASAFLKGVLFGLVEPLRDVPAVLERMTAERSGQDLTIECNGEEIAWFMEFPRTASARVLDAAVSSLKECESFESYKLEVSK